MARASQDGPGGVSKTAGAIVRGEKQFELLAQGLVGAARVRQIPVTRLRRHGQCAFEDLPDLRPLAMNAHR